MAPTAKSRPLMKSWSSIAGTWKALLLGVLLGSLGTALIFMPHVLSPVFGGYLRAKGPLRDHGQRPDWPPPEYDQKSGWSFFRVDESGWSAGVIPTYRDLSERLSSAGDPSGEVLYPVFPSVYRPTPVDKVYYDYILNSDIPRGAKALVIGSGSGADTWAVFQRTGTLVYAIDINPVAVANTKALARITGIPVRTLVGDILEVKLPDEFSDFDYVLWNMPFVQEPTAADLLALQGHHDGDDGTILMGFLRLLPSLLNENGEAIVLNYARAERWLKLPGIDRWVDPSTKHDGPDAYTIFVIPNRNAIPVEDRESL